MNFHGFSAISNTRVSEQFLHPPLHLPDYGHNSVFEKLTELFFSFAFLPKKLPRPLKDFGLNAFDRLDQGDGVFDRGLGEDAVAEVENVPGAAVGQV